MDSFSGNALLTTQKLKMNPKLSQQFWQHNFSEVDGDKAGSESPFLEWQPQ
jgi:hypothetical protein